MFLLYCNSILFLVLRFINLIFLTSFSYLLPPLFFRFSSSSPTTLYALTERTGGCENPRLRAAARYSKHHLVGAGLPTITTGYLNRKGGGYSYKIRRAVIINYQANVLVSYQPHYICLMISFYTSNREITIRNQA